MHFHYKFRLTQHLRKDCGDEPNPSRKGARNGAASLFTCDACCKSYRKRTTLNRHKKLECGKEAKFKCPLYLIRIPVSNNAYSSRKGERNVGPLFTCDACDKSYRNRTTLNRHKKLECGKEPAYQCSYCPLRTFRKKFLRRFSLFKYFAQTRTDIRSDLRARSDITFHCDACGNAYKNKVSLNRHKKIECGKEPSLPCPYCPYRTKHKSNLKTHIAIRHAAT
ncbi:hypothetical protein WDU94_005917 [Cyamophila willieti]